MTEIDATTLSITLSTALRAAIDNEDRSLQGQAGILGPSDLGWCRAKATYKLGKQTPTDTVSVWQKGMGTAAHRYYLGLLANIFPNWLIEAGKVTAKLPSGRTIAGTPDIIVPDWNMVGDLKTTDGYQWPMRTGVSQNYAFQRHCYLLGAIAAGFIDPNRDITLAQIYVDRSGQEQDPFIICEEPDWSLTNRVDAWLADVEAAQQGGYRASQDVAAPICERVCEYFTVCRGGVLPTKDLEAPIVDPDQVEAVAMYVEGQMDEKIGKQKREEAKKLLVGVNGITDKHSVRWTQIEESRVDAFTRTRHWRLDVRPLHGK